MSVLAEPPYEPVPQHGFVKLLAGGHRQPAKTPAREQPAVPATSWADRPPGIDPVGLRLRFGRGDVWIFTIRRARDLRIHID